MIAKPKPPACQYANETPFAFAAAVQLGGREHRYTMTVAVKASYTLMPGQSLALLEEQEQFRGDEFADAGDVTSELVHGNDLAMWKPGADLILRGTCHVPEAKPVAVCEVGWRVGAWYKQVRVSGDRVWRPGIFTSSPGDALPFAAMPLTWSRAFGGATVGENPCGRGRDSDLLPNIEYHDRALQRRGGTATPAGFGPVNRLWAPRRTKTGTYDKHHFERVHPRFPEDFDWSYFHEAPADQQLEGYLRGDEELTFQNLHPAAPLWTAKLPALRVRVFVADTDEQAKPRVREVVMHLDTLTADTDAGVLALVWRGLVGVRSEDRAEVSKFYVVQESLAQSPRPAEEYAAALADAPDMAGKMRMDVAAKIGAAKAKTQAILDRYGLHGAVEKAMADPGLTPQRLANFPFTPNGPMPPEVDGEVRAALAKAQEQFAKGMAEFKKLGDPHGVDLAATGKTAAAPMAQLRDAVAKAEALAASSGQEVPAALKDLAAKIKANPQDPFGLGERLAAARQQGMDLSKIPGANAIADGHGLDAAMQSMGGGAAPAVSPAPVAAGTPSSPVAPAGASLAGIDPAVTPAVPPPVGSLQDALGPAIAAAAGMGQGTISREVLLGVKRAGGSFAGGNWAGGDFSGLDLEGEDFTGAILTRARFVGAKLAKANFTSTLTQDADFSQAICSGTIFSESDFSRACFAGADLVGASFSSLALTAASFAAARMMRCTMISAGLEKADFRGADCTGATMEKLVFLDCPMDGMIAKQVRWKLVMCSDCTLDDAIFDGAVLADTVLSGCRARRLQLIAAEAQSFRVVNGCDLSEAVAIGISADGSTWMHAVLVQANFEGASLRRACLMDSWCEQARFRGADLTQAALRRGRFAKADFQNANLFQTCLGLADLHGASLLGANAYEADFTDARTTDADLRLARLTRTSLNGQQ